MSCYDFPTYFQIAVSYIVRDTTDSEFVDTWCKH